MIRLDTLLSNQGMMPAGRGVTLSLILLGVTVLACNMPQTVSDSTSVITTPSQQTDISAPGVTPRVAHTSTPQQPPISSGGQGQQPPPAKPSRTPVLIPTVVVAVPTVTLVPPTAPPEDLQQGLSNTSAATASETNFCPPGITNPYIKLVYIPGLSSIEQSESPYYQAGNQGVYGFEYLLWGCNLEAIYGDPVTITLFLPDGTQDRRIGSLTKGGQLIRWGSMPGEPLGVYTYLVETPLGSAQLSFSISAPHSPLVRAICRELTYPMPGDTDVMLIGFEANEQVELRYYSGPPATAGNLIGTQFVMVNDNGVGYATLDMGLGDYVVAIGANRVITTIVEGKDISLSGYDRMECP